VGIAVVLSVEAVVAVPRAINVATLSAAETLTETTVLDAGNVTLDEYKNAGFALEAAAVNGNPVMLIEPDAVVWVRVNVKENVQCTLAPHL